MSNPNPADALAEATEELKKKYPEASDEEIQELLAELSDKYA